MFEEVDEGHAENEEPVVFRYNRDERLKNAPQIVRDYYDGKMNPVRGIKVLWVNKGNRFILLSMVVFIAFVWIFTTINNTRSFNTINSLTFDQTSFAFQEEIYVNIKIEDKKADEKSPPVKIEAEVHFINNDNQVIEKKEISLIYRNGTESLTTKATDYDIIRVDTIVRAMDKEKELTSAVKR